jgi:assimilatory nitrate reductase electron transfer subunit
MTRMNGEHPTRIVVIGYGPVGARFVEGMLEQVRLRRVSLTVVGAETDDAYNRVLLADYAVGRSTRERLQTTDTDASIAAGVTIRRGEAAVSIDRDRQVVHLDSGELVPYDRLVFATGSRANVPTLAGIEKARRDRLALPRAASQLDRGERSLPEGIVTLRDLADAEVVRGAVDRNERVVVLGAGVLGMEVALALAEQGSTVVAVFHDEIPMARNLDRGGGRMLVAAARAAGVVMVAHARAEAVLFRDDERGTPRFDALLCADGKQIDGDVLVLSCGVSPRTELAAAAGLDVSAGILVDEKLRSWSDPDIFAIGDCAHVVDPETHAPGDRVGGAPAGLIGPGWRQADWLARAFSETATETLGEERLGVVMLKAEGVDVVSGGDFSADLWQTESEVTQWIDPARGAYVKMATKQGVLVGFVCVGLPRVGAELTLLFERRGELPADRSALLRLDSRESGAVSSADPLAPEATICWCNGVTAHIITDAIDAGSESIECIGKTTRAGTGCGTCKGKITQLLNRASPHAAHTTS